MLKLVMFLTENNRLFHYDFRNLSSDFGAIKPTPYFVNPFLVETFLPAFFGAVAAAILYVLVVEVLVIDCCVLKFRYSIKAGR